MEASDSRNRRGNLPQEVGRKILWWSWFTCRDFFTDNGVNRSAALAYITLFALVPLLATVAVLYRSFFSIHTQAIVETITGILPFSSETVAATLADFVRRATALGGIASIVFIIVVFRLFFLIEQTINEVWGVAARRSRTVRIFSFTMALFWGPVVMGLGTSLLLWIRRQPWSPSAGLLISLGQIAVPLIGFTMAYWLVLHTSVSISSAVIGGLTATTGLRLLRAGFIAYLKLFPNINLIFGSLALAVIFLTSVFAFWVIVIVGAEASYVAQNLAVLRHGDPYGQGPSPDPLLTSILLLAQCYRELEARGTPPSISVLAHRAAITHRYAKELLDLLLEAGLIAVTGRERENYLPVAEASKLTLASVAEGLQASAAPLPATADSELVDRVHRTLREAALRRREVLAEITFQDLLD